MKDTLARDQNLIDKIHNSIDEGESIAFLQKLIQTPSVFPSGDTIAVADLCFQTMIKEGIECRKVALDPRFPSVIATLGNKANPTLCLHAHMDTVSPGDETRWIYPPFSGQVANGNIFGRGAGDCKGSVAAEVMTAIAFSRAKVPLHGQIVIACVADEEGGGKLGTEYLRSAGHIKPDYLVIGEQTNNRVAICERGAVWSKISVDGKACHGALPWEGESAIMRMQAILKQIQESLLPKLHDKKHAYLPGSTLNVGVIKGGTKVNIVPDSCAIEIDRRILPDETCESVLGELEIIVRDAQRSIGPFPYRIEILSDMAISVNTSANDKFVKVFQDTASDVLGAKQPLTGYMQGSDGRFFARDGIPIVIFGPSDPKVGHSTNEFCPIAQLRDATRLLSTVAFQLLCDVNG